MHILVLTFPRTSKPIGQFWPFGYESSKIFNCYQLCEHGWAARGVKTPSLHLQHKPRGTSNQQRSLLGERSKMLWRHFNQRWCLMRYVMLPPQGKKPWEASTRGEAHMNILLAKGERTWLVAYGASGPSPANRSHGLVQELCPPPCTCWWPNDSCHERGNARAKHK